jgi:hypothetical protein
MIKDIGQISAGNWKWSTKSSELDMLVAGQACAAVLSSAPEYEGEPMAKEGIQSAKSHVYKRKAS